MKKGLLVKTVMVVWLTAVGLTACSKGNKTNSTGANGENKVSGEQLFRVTVQQELPSADLSLATNTISFSALNNVYEGLYRLGNESKPQAAGAAELATVSDDGLTYTFQLREDAKWSNGEPVVADDYVYGWQRTADSRTASEYAYLYESVKNGSDVSAGKKLLMNWELKPSMSMNWK